MLEIRDFGKSRLSGRSFGLRSWCHSTAVIHDTDSSLERIKFKRLLDHTGSCSTVASWTQRLRFKMAKIPGHGERKRYDIRRNSESFIFKKPLWQCGLWTPASSGLLEVEWNIIDKYFFRPVPRLCRTFIWILEWKICGISCLPEFGVGRTPIKIPSGPRYELSRIGWSRRAQTKMRPLLVHTFVEDSRHQSHRA